MLREALEFLVGLGRAGRSAVMLEDPAVRGGKIFIKPDGVVERIAGMVHDSCILGDQTSFLDLIDKLDGNADLLQLWLGDDTFTVWFRDGSLTLKGEWSPDHTAAFTGFKHLTATELDQRTAVHLLRRSLFDVVPSAIRDALEVCRWESGSLTTQTNTNASMGKSVDARAGVLSQFPESFMVSIAKFQEEWCPKVDVRVRIIPNPATQKFDFYPDEDAVKALEQKALEAARTFLLENSQATACFIGVRDEQ